MCSSAFRVSDPSGPDEGRYSNLHQNLPWAETLKAEEHIFEVSES